MGLDVSAYRKLTKIDCVFDAHGQPIDPHTREPLDEDFLRIRVNNDFGASRYEGLEDNSVYAYGDSMSGWSGGYGRYNAWREQLAQMAGYPVSSYALYGRIQSHAAYAWDGLAEGLPFAELVNFTDCDGVLGPVVSAKLAKDFAEHEDKAKALGEDFYSRYQEWRACFEMAADGGCVSFH